MSSAPGNGAVDPMSVGSGSSSGSANGGSPSPAQYGAAERRPELAVGAAFAGGFLVAMLLRRMRS